VGAGPFREDNKTFTAGLGGEYIQSVRADISYTTLLLGYPPSGTIH
jgi:hypothetical protein